MLRRFLLSMVTLITLVGSSAQAYDLYAAIAYSDSTGRWGYSFDNYSLGDASFAGEVADMASQCAHALDAIDYFDTAPGRFWRQVDTRRFGLATWLLHLERENRDLRQQLQGRTPR